MTRGPAGDGRSTGLCLRATTLPPQREQNCAASFGGSNPHRRQGIKASVHGSRSSKGVSAFGIYQILNSGFGNPDADAVGGPTVEANGNDQACITACPKVYATPLAERTSGWPAKMGTKPPASTIKPARFFPRSDDPTPKLGVAKPNAGKFISRRAVSCGVRIEESGTLCLWIVR